MSDIGWYALNTELEVVDREAVSLTKALEIAKGYFERGCGEHENAEDALAETMFGFVKLPEKTTFMEFCAHGEDHISFTFETPEADAPANRGFFGGLFSKIFGKVPYHNERPLTSLAEMEAKIRDFYTKAPEIIAAELDASPPS